MQKKKKLGIKDLTLSNIKGFFQGNFRLFLKNSNISLPLHILEQSEWRLQQVENKSPQCLKEGSCVHCGCEIYGKVMEDRGCETCYPPMLNETDWKNYEK